MLHATSRSGTAWSSVSDVRLLVMLLLCSRGCPGVDRVGFSRRGVCVWPPVQRQAVFPSTLQGRLLPEMVAVRYPYLWTPFGS